MNRTPTCVVAALALLVFSEAGVFGQTHAQPPASLDHVMDQLAAVRRFTEVAISPDGKRVAWVEFLQEKTKAPSPVSAISVLDLSSPSATARRVTGGKGTAARVEHDLAWSPDGHRLAFLSDREKPGQFQLYVAAAGETSGRKVTNLTGSLAKPRWSPDGKVLALLFSENAPRTPGPLEPRTPDTGVVEEHVYEQRLITVELASGRIRSISPADLYVYEYDWSPDGNSFVATAAHGAGDNNWWFAQLYTIAVASGETHSILTPSLQIAEPRWSPDGKSIAFIGGLMSDEDITGGDIFIVPATGGEPRNVTAGMKASASWLAWLPTSNHILFTEHSDGASGIATVDPANGQVATLWSGSESIEAKAEPLSFSPSLSLSREGQTVAVIRHSFDHPPEVWAGSIGDWKQLTHANANIHPNWGEATSLHWTSDGMNVQGWLLYPHSYNPNRRYPLVVVVHGGPAWATRPAWPDTFFAWTVLSHAGYFVLFPNPRGSYGQGETFTQANVKDFGHGDLRDILAGVDEVVKTLPVDTDRIGITGWSYGGYMTMWAVTQTNRFQAAVAGAGVANWQSYYGQNGIDQWMIPYFGASVYDDPAVYAHSSPITFIKNVKTPTLILVGERDSECPVPQSYEFWHALKTLGVKTQLVIYPNEGHVIAQSEHRRDIIRRMVGWFNEHLKQSQE
ncbi:MAG: S9 family peptidase [Deltaproteobacteria bacterium]|nr:S9 family peptidase [Deltaproteobacteria bacterium]